MADGDVAPASSDNDKWHDAITLLTGFTPPPRGTVFKDLYGNDEIPLMKVEIHDSSATPSNAELDAINDLSWRTQNSGWRIENTDFSVPFYSGTNGAVGALPVGSEVKMRKARITLLGTDTAHNVPAGGVDMGSKFGAGSHLMPDGFKGWDSTMLANYSYGGGLALEQLLNPPYTTHGWGMNGKNVADGDSVDVNTFELAADAFDRAALFFSMSRQTIQNWEDQLGSEDAAWRGQAAGVFWDMIHQLGINYQNYSDALPLTLFQSKAGYDLRQAKQGFVNAITNLHSTWSTWALYTGNPLRWLHDILLEVTDDIWYNNITKVRYKYGYTEGDYGHQEVEYDGFRANVGSYGNLDDLSTWKAIGNEAISRWQQSVKDTLEVAGKQALIDVNNTFVDIPQDLHVLTTTQVNLISDYQADKSAAEQDKADAAAAAAQAKADQQRADDQAAAAAAQAKADAAAAAAEAKADKQRADDLAHQQQIEDEQKRQREEDLAHQRQIEDEQRKQYEQQQLEQKQQQEQQKQEQQQQQEEQRQQQQQQQDEQKRQYEEQMAVQAAYQQKQEKQQEEQQAKQDQQQQRQEQLQQQQEAEQKQQYEQQRQDQQQQQEEQKQQQQRQEALAQQQYAQQQQTQSDYQKKQEDAQQKQQQQQQQQQDLQQKQYEQQRQDQQQQYAQLGQYPPQQGNGQLQSLQQQQDQFQQQLENTAHGQIGSQTHLNPDGTVTTDYTDGSSTTINPHTGLETTTLADGTVTTDHLSGAHQLTNPDGSHTTVNQDGTVTTRYPDGSVSTVNPHTGTATTHEPDGKTVTTPLGGGATLPHSSYANVGTGTQYPSYQQELYDSTPYHAGSLGSPGYSGVAASASGPGTSQSGAVLPLGTRIDGTTTGGGVPAGGAPMTGGGMPMMGGMGGMGGGGANNGSGERVREVYEDEDVVTNGGSLGRRAGTGRRGFAEEEAGTSGRRTSTSSAYDPFMGGEDHERTQSGDRERDAWVPEEEDVWGTDEGGAPAVIGG
jgi:hypothetical protein